MNDNRSQIDVKEKAKSDARTFFMEHPEEVLTVLRRGYNEEFYRIDETETDYYNAEFFVELYRISEFNALDVFC